MKDVTLAKSAIGLFLLLFVAPSVFALTSVSDLGYHPGSVKHVTVYTSATTGTFSVVSTTGATVMSGTLSRPTDYNGNPVNCQGNNPCLVGDFSSVAAPGTYYVTTSLGQTSRTFPINALIYRNNAPLFNQFYDALSMRNSSYHADMNRFADPALFAMADGSYLMTADQAALTLMRLGDAYRRNPALLSSDAKTFVRPGTPDIVEHMMLYADYLASLQDAAIQQRTDGVGFRINTGMKIDNAFVPGPTSLTSLNVYDAGKGFIASVPVVSLCGSLSGSAYTACIDKATRVYKCQPDEPCLQLSYVDKTGTRVPGQTDGLGVDNGWQYEFGCFYDVNLQGGNYNGNTANPCLVYDTAESRANAVQALLAYAEAIPAINQYDPAKASQLLGRAIATQQYIKSTLPITSASSDAGYYGAANFLLYDMTGDAQYLNEAYAVRGFVSTQLNSGGTSGEEFYWQEYLRHQAAIQSSGKAYFVGTTDPVEFYRGKMWGDYKDLGFRSISANGEHIYQFDNNIQFMNSRWQLTEGVFAAKTRDFDSSTPVYADIADSQLAWLTGNNGVDIDPSTTGTNIQSVSFIFGIGQFPQQFHSRLLMDSSYSALTGGSVVGMRGTNMMFNDGTGFVFLDGRSFILGNELGAPGNAYRGETSATQLAPKTFTNGKTYIPGWINGAFDVNYDFDDIYNYDDNRQAYEFTESTNELVAAAITLFAYRDAQLNNVAALPMPRITASNPPPPNGTGGGGGGGGGNTTPPGCFGAVKDIPAVCDGGTITQDTFDGCRHITCASGSDNMAVLACDKPDTNAPQHFEMYRQASAGTAVKKICLGTTCISDNGYARSGNYPICNGTAPPPPPPPPLPPSNSTCFDNVPNIPATCKGGSLTQDYTASSGCRITVCQTAGSALQTMSCDKPGSYNAQYFEMYKQTTAGSAPLQICIDGACISLSGSSYAKSGSYPVCVNGSTNGTGPVTCSHNGQQYTPGQTFNLGCNVCTCQNDGQIVCTTNACPSTGATVSVAPWYPQGRNYIFVCSASGFTPTSYDWNFGDGHQQLNMDINNVYHTYAAAGSYNVACTAKSASQSATGTLGVTVS